MKRIICTLAILVLLGTYCVQPEPSMKEATLAKFNSAEEMLAYMTDQVARGRSSMMGGLEDNAALTAPNATGGGSDSGYSTTNIQEAGVDESDVVKNDGTYIYLLKNNSLRIIQAVPADAVAEVGRLDLAGWSSSLYLLGDKLVVLSGLSGATRTIVTLIDIRDRTQPAIEQTWEFDAVLAASRLIGDQLHLVLQSWPQITYNSGGQMVLGGTLDTIIPGYRLKVAGRTIQEGKIVDWSHCYHPVNGEGYDLTTLTTIDVADPTAEPQSSGITAGTGVVYASPTSIYITSSQSYWWYAEDAGDKTTVHKFDVTGDRAVYIGGGEVPGHLLNQYSLGEKNGYLRLGTTVGHVSRSATNTSVNAVYVLDREANEGKLNIVGRVENIAPSEQIYSARFVGDRGFLVTFKKVDPLYTLDLSDPTQPRLIGQLKVPGYSDYIHVLDADHLLTIGKDAYDMGTFAWYQGVQLSIFDVSDFANPQLTAKEVIGVRGTESEANYNPKAFNYYPQQNALAIPIRLAESAGPNPNDYGTHTFDGLYVYHVSAADGFTLLGRISTSSVMSSSYYGYGSSYTRGIFIGDDVYAVSDNTVVAAPTADPSQVWSSLTLP